jgi:hypothetical protein
MVVSFLSVLHSSCQRRQYSAPHRLIPFRRPVYSTGENVWSLSGDAGGKYDSAKYRDKEDLHGKRALGYEPTLHRPWVPQRIFRRA